MLYLYSIYYPRYLRLSSNWCASVFFSVFFRRCFKPCLVSFVLCGSFSIVVCACVRLFIPIILPTRRVSPPATDATPNDTTQHHITTRHFLIPAQRSRLFSVRVSYKRTFRIVGKSRSHFRAQTSHAPNNINETPLSTWAASSRRIILFGLSNRTSACQFAKDSCAIFHFLVSIFSTWFFLT